jgi:hypothetical protein
VDQEARPRIRQAQGYFSLGIAGRATRHVDQGLEPRKRAAWNWYLFTAALAPAKV